MGRPANCFTGAGASISGAPRQAPFSLLLVVVRGRAGERLPVSLRLQGEILGHCLNRQDLFPRKLQITFFLKIL